ncbi:MAG: lytic transglycosylase domain-containing protein [Pseudomonadota bacterium]
MRGLIASGIIALSISVVSGAVLAGNTYIYKENDGTIWYTNKKPVGVERDKYKLVGVFGRPTASVSCRGMTPKRMEDRARQYESDINRYAKRYGVSHLLVKAIISVESCFDERAVSRAGARGLMQLMPQTAQYLGVSNSFDARENIYGGVRYYSEMQARFHYNDTLALAAYNAGPSAVEKYNGIPPFRETQNYVKRVLKKYREYLAQN